MSYLRYVRFVFTSSCLQEVLFTLFVSVYVQWCSTHIVLCSVRLYLQLFVGGVIYVICVCLCIVVFNTYCVMFGSSLPPVVCRRCYLRYFCLFMYSGVQHILCYVRFIFTSSCLQEVLFTLFVSVYVQWCSTHIVLCSVRLYLQLFVGGVIYVICVCLCIVVFNTYCVMFGSSLPPVVCRRCYLRYFCLFMYSGVQHILCYVRFVFTSSCLQEVLFTLFVSVYVQWCSTHIVLCSVCLYLQLFVGGVIYVICVCLCIVVFNTYCVMFGSSLPPVVCRRCYLRYLCLFMYSGVQHILCYVRFIFTSSCLQEVLFTLFLSVYVQWCSTHIVLCLIHLYLQLFVGGVIYVICVCLCIVVFNTYCVMFGSSLPPVVCRRCYLRYLCLFMYSGVQHILCYVRFVFTSSCLQEVLFTLFVSVYVQWCSTHIVLCLIHLYLQLFVGGVICVCLCIVVFNTYCVMFDSSLPPVVCRRCYLRYLCLFMYSGVQHILCYV